MRFRCVSAVLALLRSDRRIASDQSGYRFGSVAGGGGWSRLQSIKPFGPLGLICLGACLLARCADNNGHGPELRLLRRLCASYLAMRSAFFYRLNTPI